MLVISIKAFKIHKISSKHDYLPLPLICHMLYIQG